MDREVYARGTSELIVAEITRLENAILKLFTAPNNHKTCTTSTNVGDAIEYSNSSKSTLPHIHDFDELDLRVSANATLLYVLHTNSIT